MIICGGWYVISSGEARILALRAQICNNKKYG